MESNNENIDQSNKTSEEENQKNQEELEKCLKSMTQCAQQMMKEMIKLANIITRVVSKQIEEFVINASYILSNMKKRKLTKKKFIKLLRSEGIHRDIINETIKDNKEPYTYLRYYETLIKLKR